MLSNAQLASMIRPDAVKRDIYLDPEIFELEIDRIFRRAWLYIAHESQLAKPGDFVTARHGRDKIIVARHADGKLYAFYNRCPHRGAEVCARSAGNANIFVCPYHAWSFRTDGSLHGIPHATPGYGAEVARLFRERGLERLPRVESYRGFVFANAAADGISLHEFLGPEVRAVFDNFVDRAPDGELEIAGGKLVQRFNANWKFQIENSIDLLHPSILHKNAIDAARAHRIEGKIDEGTRAAIDLLPQNWNTFPEWDRIPVYTFDRGHCFMGTFFKKTASRDTPGDDARLGSDDAFLYAAQARYKSQLVARHGEGRANEILAFSRHNTIVYPNLFVNPRIQQLRVLCPISADTTEQHCWALRLKGAPAETFHIAVRILNSSNSPSSLATTDDHEVFEQMQQSLARGGNEWLDLSRGLGREVGRGEGSAQAEGTSEAPMRNQYRAWLGYMTGGIQ